MFIWCSLHLEYFEYLINLRVSYKQGLALSHLSVNAPNAPYVNRCRVLFGPKEDFWRTVPQGDDLVGVCLDRQAKRPSQSKICQLHVSIRVDQEILWLQVSVHDAMRVTVGSGLQNLISELLYCLRRQRSPDLPHILLEIILTILENEIEVVFLVYHFLEPVQHKSNRSDFRICFPLTLQRWGA